MRLRRILSLPTASVVDNSNPRYLQTIVAMHDAQAQDAHIAQQKLNAQRAALRTQVERDLFDLDQEWQKRKYSDSPMSEDEYDERYEKLRITRRT